MTLKSIYFFMKNIKLIYELFTKKKKARKCLKLLDSGKNVYNCQKINFFIIIKNCHLVKKNLRINKYIPAACSVEAVQIWSANRPKPSLAWDSQIWPPTTRITFGRLRPFFLIKGWTNQVVLGFRVDWVTWWYREAYVN